MKYAEHIKKNRQRFIYRLVAALISIIASVVILTGCASISKPFKFISTYSITNDPRTIGTQFNDKAIVNQAEKNITSGLSNGKKILQHIEISSFEGRVMILGSLSSEDEINLVKEKVEMVRGVKEILNQLYVGKPRSMMQYTEDHIIKEKIETKLMLEKNIVVPHYKIHVYNSKVFVLGIYSDRKELDRVLFIASDTNGAKKIINYAIHSYDSRRK